MKPAGADAQWSLPRRQILRRRLRDDPEQDYFVYVPGSGGPDAPLFVSVHGLSRNAQEQATLFSPYCENHGAVLVAPHFTAKRHRNYHRLGRGERGDRADLALESIVEEVVSLTGTSATRIHLFGYSGGAQFVHRYAMAHPQRVARAVVASAAEYSLPDLRKRFPSGIRSSQKLPGVRFDPQEFLHVPIAVLVGRQEASEELPRIERADRPGRATRAEAARHWVSAMKKAARARHLESLVSYEEVDGNDHSFKQFMKSGALGKKVFEVLFGTVPDGTVPNDARSDSVEARGDAPPELERGEAPGAADEAARASAGESFERLRRLARPLALWGAALAVITPIALFAHYRLTNVLARDALVRGHIADVGAQIDGVVRSVAVDAGDPVRAGQVVARLEDRHLKARVEQARSQLEKATRELEVEHLAIDQERRRLGSLLEETSAKLAAAKAGALAAKSQADDAGERLQVRQRLAREGVTSAEQVRDAEGEYRTASALLEAARADGQAAAAVRLGAKVESEGLAVREERIAVLASEIAALRAELEVAEAGLEASLIRAPEDGAVVNRIVQPGGSVVVGQPIISLWLGEDLWVEAWIDEDDLSQVEVGAPAVVTLKSYPDHEYTGVVESIGVSTDTELPETEVPQPRDERMRDAPVLAVRIRLDEPGGRLLPGLSAVVAIRKAR